MEALRFLNLLCTGVVSGTYVFELLVVVPALAAAPEGLSAQVHRALFSHLPNRYMPLVGVTGGMAAALVLVLDESVTGTARALYIAGLAMWGVTFVLLAGFSRPIDKTIARWGETDLPAGEYGPIRAAWDRLMMIRGPLGLAAFACFIVAALEAA
jgi:hypothetical protein